MPVNGLKGEPFLGTLSLPCALLTRRIPLLRGLFPGRRENPLFLNPFQPKN